MSFIVGTKQPKKYEIPAEGQHIGVLVDIVDAGEKTGQYGTQQRVRFVWVLKTLGMNGRPLQAMQGYNVSPNWGEKSHLRKAVKSILGRDPDSEFDLETLIGCTNLLIVEHNTVGDKTYANVTTILKTAESLPIPKEYVRVADRRKPSSSDALKEEVRF